MRSPLKWLTLAVVFLGEPAFALPERVLSFDVGTGSPELVFAHTQVQVWKRWQFGVGYSYIPNVPPLGQAMQGPSTTLTLADGFQYETSPTIVPRASFFSGFVRYFPAENNFYFQLSYSLAQMTAHVTTGLENSALSTSLVGALIEADIVFRQAIPALSIGYLFQGKFFYFNISLGAAWVGAFTTSMTVNALIPDLAGGATGNQAALTQLQQDLQARGVEAAASLRQRFPILPSLLVSFGIQF